MSPTRLATAPSRGRRRPVEVGSFRLTDWSQPPRARLGWHVHDAPSLSLSLGGRYRETYRRRDVECAAGDLVVKPAGETHSNRIADEGARTLLVEIPRPAAAGLEDALHRLDAPVLRADPHTRALAGRCRAELRRGDDWVELALESLALELVVHAARRSGPAGGRAAPPWLPRALAFLRESSAEGLRVSDVARECGVHPAHLARVFRHHLGCSVGEWIREARLARAVAELEGGARAADAARRAGFYDHSHFARVLRRRTGMRPSDLGRRTRS